MQLQLHYTNYTTPQLQLHYTTTTTTAARHHATSSSCGWGNWPGDHCNHCSHSKKHSSNSNHLSVHQWIRAAIRDSQQPISPIGFLFLKLPPPPCAVLLVIIIAKTSAGYSLLVLKPPSCGKAAAKETLTDNLHCLLKYILPVVTDDPPADNASLQELIWGIVGEKSNRKHANMLHSKSETA